MSEYQRQFLSAIGGAVLLWIVVAGALIYNHNLLLSEHLSDTMRRQRETPLIVFAILWIVFNGFRTAMRLQRLRRNRPPDGMRDP